jgi:hypothetical protein
MIQKLLLSREHQFTAFYAALEWENVEVNLLHVRNHGSLEIEPFPTI